MNFKYSPFLLEHFSQEHLDEVMDNWYEGMKQNFFVEAEPKENQAAKDWLMTFIIAKNDPYFVEEVYKAGIEERQLYLIFVECCAALGVDVDARLKIVVFSLSVGIPGVAVMYAHFLKRISLEKGLNVVKLEDVFSSKGYPTHGYGLMTKCWDLQKVDGVNLLDCVSYGE